MKHILLGPTQTQAALQLTENLTRMNYIIRTNIPDNTIEDIAIWGWGERMERVGCAGQRQEDIPISEA